jgi:hypothetical protein
MALAYTQVAAKALTAANTEESMYVVPASTAVVGWIGVFNTGTGNRTFRLAIVSGGGSAGAADYVAYDVSLTPGESWDITGLTLAATDEIRVESDATSTTAGTGVIFHLYGETIT